MQNVNPHTIKILCIILITSLSIVICSVIKDIFFSDFASDWSMIVFLGFLTVPVFIYLITISYCNKLENEIIIGNKKSRFIFLLVITILGLLFSIIALLMSSFGFYDAISEGDFDLSNRDFFNIVLIFIDFIYVVISPIVFFLQLQLRKKLLKEKETSTNWLIDSIGTKSNNSND